MFWPQHDAVQCLREPPQIAHRNVLDVGLTEATIGANNRALIRIQDADKLPPMSGYRSGSGWTGGASRSDASRPSIGRAPHPGQGHVAALEKRCDTHRHAHAPLLQPGLVPWLPVGGRVRFDAVVPDITNPQGDLAFDSIVNRCGMLARLEAQLNTIACSGIWHGGDPLVCQSPDFHTDPSGFAAIPRRHPERRRLDPCAHCMDPRGRPIRAPLCIPPDESGLRQGGTW